MLELDEQQGDLTDWALAGPTLVKGGPGSGKSIVALYRVRALVERSLKTTGQVPRIWFATYTNPLIQTAKSLLIQLLGDLVPIRVQQLPRRIRVSTVDETVRWIAQSSQECPGLAGREAQWDALRWARAAIKPRAMGEMEKLRTSMAVRSLGDSTLMGEFEWVIEGQNCRRLDDYLTADRSGRGIPFNETVRTAVWRLYEEYRARLREQNLCSWGKLRQFALELVRRDGFVRRWDHVIIDEAQDLTPAALALCVELAREPSGVFLTADANQSLYNRSFRWRAVHEMLKVSGRTRLLRGNYRNTREIASAASDLWRAIKGRDAEAMEQEYVHSGTKPVIYAAGGAADQAQWLAARIGQTCGELELPVSAAAVLAPGESLAKSVADELQAQGLVARYVKSRDVHLEGQYVKVMTLHAVKGLEFPIVGIAHVEADRLPRETGATHPREIAEHVDDERRVFYVGCTRATRRLFVTHDRGSPSPFLDELSEEHWVREGGEEKTEANSS